MYNVMYNGIIDYKEFKVSQGWIKVHRKVIDNFLYPKNENRKFTKYEAWLDLLLMVTHKPLEIIYHGDLVQLQKGEFITSDLQLANRWNWHRQTVKRFMELLKTKAMIETQKVNEKNIKTCTILKITNYRHYQTFFDYECTTERTGDGTRDCTLNKNEKNEKKYYKNKNFQKDYHEGLLVHAI